MLTRELIERRTALLAEIDAIPLDQSDEFDRKTAELRAIEARIKFAEERDAADRRAPGTRIAEGSPAIECRAFAGVSSPLPAEFRGSLWRTTEGLAVPALAPADRLVDFLPAGESRANELGLGGFLRVLHSGARTPDEQRVLSGLTIGQGGATIPADLSATIIDAMRPRMVTIAAGATTVPMATRQFRIARQTADAIAQFRAEGLAITESDPVFDQVLLDSKTLACRFNLTRELIEDGQNIGAKAQDVLANAMALALDQAVLVGSGAANQPLGIRGQAGIQSVSMGTNGAQLTNWIQPLNAVQALETANAGNITAMVMAPRTARAIYGFVATDGQPLQPPPRLANVPVLASTSVPINEVQGTSGAVASSIFTGDFSEVLIGLRTELQIQVLQERFAEVGQIGFIAWMRADVALARPAAIARILGIIP